MEISAPVLDRFFSEAKGNEGLMCLIQCRSLKINRLAGSMAQVVECKHKKAHRCKYAKICRLQRETILQ
jgi:hypothetical protein